MTDHELMQLSEVVGLALKQRGATLTTAESCTGGWIAKAITDIAGSINSESVIIAPLWSG